MGKFSKYTFSRYLKNIRDVKSGRKKNRFSSQYFNGTMRDTMCFDNTSYYRRRRYVYNSKSILSSIHHRQPARVSPGHFSNDLRENTAIFEDGAKQAALLPRIQSSVKEFKAEQCEIRLLIAQI